MEQRFSPPRSVSETARRTPAETITHIETGYGGGRHAPAAAGGVQRCGVAAALAQLRWARVPAPSPCQEEPSFGRLLLAGSFLPIPSFYNPLIGKGAKPVGLAPHFAYELYLANSVARVSRMTLTLICPGYSSSFSMRLTISLASSTESASLTCSGLTMMRTSRPA